MPRCSFCSLTVQATNADPDVLLGGGASVESLQQDGALVDSRLVRASLPPPSSCTATRKWMRGSDCYESHLDQSHSDEVTGGRVIRIRERPKGHRPGGQEGKQRACALSSGQMGGWGIPSHLLCHHHLIRLAPLQPLLACHPSPAPLSAAIDRSSNLASTRSWSTCPPLSATVHGRRWRTC